MHQLPAQAHRPKGSVTHPQALTDLGASTGMEATAQAEPSNECCLAVVSHHIDQRSSTLSRC
jgi:hypothetical protein